MLVAPVMLGLTGAQSVDAAEAMLIRPLTSQIEIAKVPVAVDGSVSIALATRSDRTDGEVTWTLTLEGLEPQGAAIARATGLEAEACKDDRPVAVKVTRAELVPADPAVTLRLFGTIRAWLCKPIKTHLSPELDVVAETMLTVQVIGATAGLKVSNTHVTVADIDRLGPLKGKAQEILDERARAAQTDFQAALDAHPLRVDQLLAPMVIETLQAGFAGKNFTGTLRGHLEAQAASNFLASLISKAFKP